MLRPALAIVLIALATGCASRGSTTARGYNPYAPLEDPITSGPIQVDGVKYKDPGPVRKVQNAFNTFRY